jgi:hypothetical protein
VVIASAIEVSAAAAIPPLVIEAASAVAQADSMAEPPVKAVIVARPAWAVAAVAAVADSAAAAVPVAAVAAAGEAAVAEVAGARSNHEGRNEDEKHNS